MTTSIPVYFINLASRPDRLRHIEAELRHCGISAERIDAVSPQTLPADVAKNLQLRPAVRACTESHMVAWRQLIASGAHAALIIEDDARLSPLLPGFLAWHELGGNWYDVIKIETRGHRLWLSAIGQRQAPHNLSVKRLLCNHVGTTGYLITRRMAERALLDPEIETIPIDIYLFGRKGNQLYRSRIYQVAPGLCSAEDHTLQPNAELARSDIRPDPNRPLRRTARRPRVRSVIRSLWSFGRRGMLFGLRWQNCPPVSQTTPVSQPHQF